MLNYSIPKQLNSILRSGIVLLSSLFVSATFILLFASKLRLSFDYTFGESGLRGSLVSCWNQAADTLGNFDYIILDKYNGEGGQGIFLLLLFVVLSIAAFLIIRSKFKFALLIFIIPEFLIAVYSSVEISVWVYIFSVAAILNAVIFISSDNGWQAPVLTFAVLGMFFVCYTSFPEVFSTNAFNGIASNVQDAYYGTDPLGHGDLRKRTRNDATKDKIALRVEMSDPQSMYLKGFVGGNFDGRKWSPLSNATYYQNISLFDNLESNGFNVLGQLSQAASLIGEGAIDSDDLNTLTVENISADSRYAFVPYDYHSEINMNGELKGGDIFSNGKFGSFKKYVYTSSVNQVERWTDLAGEFFTYALAGQDENIKSYLNQESHYNEFVYENYTSIGLKERELLAASIGSRGDQSKGHMDYKLAIESTRKYLEDEFVYSADLGTKSLTSNNELEEFIHSRKGFDIHYATLATLIFRYYGIPARYVEGYLITPDDVSKAEESIDLKRENAHAWTEIYIDGIGFVPLEVTPSYYGVMKEADMTSGISNEKLVYDFINQFSNSKIPDVVEDEDESEYSDEGTKMLVRAIAGVVLFIILILILFLLHFLIRRIIDSIKLWKLFHNAEPKKAVSAIYNRMEDLGLDINDETRSLGNLAAYSLDTITEEDRKFMLNQYKKAKAANRSNSFKSVKPATLLILLLLVPLLSSCSKQYKSFDDLSGIQIETINYLMDTIPDPTTSAAGGDILVFALKKSGTEIQENYYEKYYDNVCAALKKNKGVLSEDKYTEYERAIIGICAIGKNPENVAGYDLTVYLDDYDKVTNQGVNAAWYALLSARVADIELKHEDDYVDYILNSIITKEYDGKGLSDYISIGIQALSGYVSNPQVKTTIDDSIDVLSSYQDADGSMGNCESTAMCIIALTMNDINPFTDERFIKDGNTLIDGLMKYYLSDGAFCHTMELREPNIMASEQALMALDSINLFEKGAKLYD